LYNPGLWDYAVGRYILTSHIVTKHAKFALILNHQPSSPVAFVAVNALVFYDKLYENTREIASQLRGQVGVRHGKKHPIG